MNQQVVRLADSEAAVRERYTAAARQREAGLCCAVSYDTRLLEVIPQEVIERDYGCGDPSRYVREGDVVLDLGSGSGKIFVASSGRASRGSQSSAGRPNLSRSSRASSFVR